MRIAFVQRAWLRIRYYWKSLSFFQVLLRVCIDGCAKLGLRIEPYYVMAEGLCLGAFSWDEQDFTEYEFRLLTERDMKALATLPDRAPSEEELNQRLREGKHCFGALHHGEVVAFTWWSFTECSFESSSLFALHVNEAYLFDAYTTEAFRGSGIAPYLRYRCYQTLAQVGREHCYSITVAFNHPALRFKQKLHAQITQLNVLIEILWRWRRHSPLKRYPFRWPETHSVIPFAPGPGANSL